MRNVEGGSPASWMTQLEGLPCDTPFLEDLHQMPRSRDLTVRAEHSVTLWPVVNREAALGQVRGWLAAVACERCARGDGPFAECVLVIGRFGGACCNCHYEARDSLCCHSLSGSEYPTREITDDVNNKLLLTIQQQCNKQDISLPWKEIGETMGAKISRSAIIQHLAKLRIRMVAQGLPVPPPPFKRSGGTKLPTEPKLLPRAAAVARTSTACDKSSKESGKPIGMIEDHMGSSAAEKHSDMPPYPFALKQVGSAPIMSQDVAKEETIIWPALSEHLTYMLDPLPPINSIIRQSHREELQVNKTAINPEIAAVACAERFDNPSLKRALSQAGESLQSASMTRSTCPGYKVAEVIDLTSDDKEGPWQKRRRFEDGNTPSKPSSSGTLPPRGHNQDLQRAIAEVDHLRQQNHDMTRRNQQLMRIARQEEATRQHLSKQNEQLQRVSMHEQVNKEKQASRQGLDQLGPVTIQGRANIQDLNQQVEHLQGTHMQKEFKYQDLSQQIEHLKGTVNSLIMLVERLRGSNSREHLAKLTVIKNVVVSNANLEAAVDAREAEMRVGLSNLWGNPEQMKGQAMQLLDYSNSTSSLVSRLVVGAMLEHQGFLSDEEHKAMELQYDNAKPNPEVAAIMAEKLTFMLDGPDGSHLVTL